MHYVANTVYHAGDRDHRGLRAGESRQLRNGKTGELCWQLEPQDAPRYYDGPEAPPPLLPRRYLPWMIDGIGKARDLDAARRSAVWPDATDADLCAEPDALTAALLARLPDRLARFQATMLSCGFVWPEVR